MGSVDEIKDGFVEDNSLHNTKRSHLPHALDRNVVLNLPPTEMFNKVGLG